MEPLFRLAWTRTLAAAVPLLAWCGSDREARLVPLDGESFSAEVVSVDQQGVLRYRVGGEEKAKRLTGFRFVEFAPAASGVARPARFFSLRSGQYVQGDLIGGEGADARFRLFTGEEVLIPIRFLRGWRSGAEVVEKDLGFLEVLAAELPKQDLLFVVQDGTIRRVPAKVAGIRGEKLMVEYGGEQRPLPLARVYGVVLAEGSGAEPVRSPQTPRVAVRVRAGHEVEGLLVELGGGSLQLRFDEGFRAKVPLSDVARIGVVSDRLLFLSAAPAAVDQTPAFNRKWPVAMDRSLEGGPIRLGGRTWELGICMVPRTRMTWSLAGRYHVFAATIGIGDEVGDAGHAVFRVLGDGKELFVADGVRGGETPRDIRLDIQGVDRLSLEADFGEGLDLGDHCVFAEARVLVKT